MGSLASLSSEVKQLLEGLGVTAAANMKENLLELVVRGDLTPGEYEWALAKILSGICYGEVLQHIKQ